MQKKNGFLRVIVVSLLMLIGITVALLTGIKGSMVSERESMERVLTDSARAQAKTLTMKFNDQFDVLASGAEYAAANPYVMQNGELSYFELLLNAGGFTDIGLASEDGVVSWMIEKNSHDVSAQSYFINAINGQSNIYFILSSTPGGKPTIVYSVPIRSDGRVVGAFFAKGNIDSIVDLLSSEVANGRGYSFVCDSAGHILIEPGSSEFLWNSYFKNNPQASLFDALEQVEFYDGGSVSKFKADIEGGASGVFSYKYDLEERYGIYEPLQYNGWFLLNAIDTQVIDDAVYSSIKTGVMSIGLVILFFILAAGGVAYFEGKNRKASKAERDKLDLAEREEKRLIIENNERFRVAMQAISTSTWDLDIATKTIHQGDDSIEQHGFSKEVKNVPDSLIDCGFVHPDSAEVLRSIYAKIYAGEDSADGIVKVKRPDSKGWWYEHIRYFNLFDNKGVPYRAIGMGQDVTDKQQLPTAAESDSLTGLLNHNAVIGRIGAAISDAKEGHDALFVIDIDNFKSVNDTMGHQTGDEVLENIAHIIKGIFRAEDIVGRFGGDEYIALMRGVPSVDIVRKKAEKLINLLQIHCSDTAGGEISLSASIGITMLNPGESFETLFRRADKALYNAKNAGRNRYAVSTEIGDDGLVKDEEGQSLSIVQLQMLMENIDGGIVLFEAAEGYNVKYISPGFYKMVGISKDAVAEQGEQLLDVVAPESRDELRTLIDRCARLGEKIDYSYRVLNTLGKYSWRHIRAVRSTGGMGSRQVLALVTDITEMHVADNILNAIVEHSPYGIGIFDIDNGYAPLFANELLLRRTRCTKEEFFSFCGLEVLNTLEFAELEKVKDAIRLAGAENRSVETIVAVRDRIDDEIHRIRMNIVIASVDGVKIAYVTFYDITKSVSGYLSDPGCEGANR